jgi:hypothetical protein
VATVRSVRVKDALELFDLDGAALPVRDVRMEITYDDDETVQRIAGLFVVDFADWERVDKQRLFHLEPNLRGALFGGSFDPAKEVEIEAKLDDAQAAQAAEVAAGDEFDIGGLLWAAGSGDAIACTESWFGMFVKQADGDVKVGFKTDWAPF